MITDFNYETIIDLKLFMYYFWVIFHIFIPKKQKKQMINYFFVINNH